MSDEWQPTLDKRIQVRAFYEVKQKLRDGGLDMVTTITSATPLGFLARRKIMKDGVSSWKAVRGKYGTRQKAYAAGLACVNDP